MLLCPPPKKTGRIQKHQRLPRIANNLRVGTRGQSRELKTLQGSRLCTGSVQWCNEITEINHGQILLTKKTGNVRIL